MTRSSSRFTWPRVGEQFRVTSPLKLYQSEVENQHFRSPVLVVPEKRRAAPVPTVVPLPILQ